LKGVSFEERIFQPFDSNCSRHI